MTAAVPAGDFASLDVPLAVWLALLAAIATMLVVDLLLVHKTAHVITMKEAAIESGVWITLGLAFGAVIVTVVAPSDWTTAIAAWYWALLLAMVPIRFPASAFGPLMRFGFPASTTSARCEVM